MIGLKIVKICFFKIIKRFLNYREICRCGPNYRQKLMVMKAAECRLIKFFFLTIESNFQLFSPFQP